MTFDYDTVKSAEKREEGTLKLGLTKLTKPRDVDPSRYRKGRMTNLTCPACGELLPEVITIGGKPQGWCGVKRKYVGD